MKVPRYDHTRDGCPFAWCMTAAAAERARRQDAVRAHAEMQARAHAASVARLKRAEAAMERPARG